MTNREIAKRVREIQGRLAALEHEKERELFDLRHVRAACVHPKRKRWTNNDGDGRFAVERCEVCGLQKDGGLG
jgi:hypothetical protein